jgi:hypothetical protein
LVKFLAQAAPIGSGDYPIVLKTGITLAQSVPEDLVAWAGKQIIKLQAKKAAQQEVIAGLNAQLALMTDWEDGSPLQVAKKEEVTTQKAAVESDIAAIDAEILRLTPDQGGGD